MKAKNSLQSKYFYQSLCLKLEISESRYDFYINARTFGSALSLLFSNIDIQRCICENMKYAQESDIAGLESLVAHYTSWFSDFELHAFRSVADFDSLFIFDGSKSSMPYPKDFVDELLARKITFKISS